MFPELGVSKIAIAKAMKISRNQLYLILGERQPVTPDTAERLAAAVGGSPRIWLNMQSAESCFQSRSGRPEFERQCLRMTDAVDKRFSRRE